MEVREKFKRISSQTESLVIFNMVGDGLMDALESRLRGVFIRYIILNLIRLINDNRKINVINKDCIFL